MPGGLESRRPRGAAGQDHEGAVHQGHRPGAVHQPREVEAETGSPEQVPKPPGSPGGGDAGSQPLHPAPDPGRRPVQNVIGARRRLDDLRQSGDHPLHPVADGRGKLVQTTMGIPELPHQSVGRTDAGTHLVGNQHESPAGDRDRHAEIGELRRQPTVTVHEVRKPEREAVHHHGTAGSGGGVKRRGKIHRRLDGPESTPAVPAMADDTRGHFGVERLRGGDEDPFGGVSGEGESAGALPGTCSTKNQYRRHRPKSDPTRHPRQGAPGRFAAVRILGTILVALLPFPAAAREPSRIVSLDYCADQFVLKLVERDRILAVSPDAVKSFSYMRKTAEGIPQVRPRVEDVLPLDPDLVVRSYGGGPGLGAFLARAGVRVAQVGPADDFDGVKRILGEMAAALGAPARGAALIRDMELREAALPGEAGRETMLYLTPSGVTTGPGTLVHEMMRMAGFRNYQEKPGWRSIPLERLAYGRPDRIAAAFFNGDTAMLESWSAMRHPVARTLLRDLPVMTLPGAWTACGSWFLLDAIEALAAAR